MRRCLLALGLWLVCLCLGGAEERGIPFLRNISPREYSAFFQNWAVAQDGRGLIYAGNVLGVLEYDGVRWRLIPTPRGALVRSLATDESGRVFVGSVGDFGYLEPGADGQTRFVSLLNQIPAAERSFTDIWTILVTGKDVYFQSYERLFRWRDGKIQSWPASKSLQTSALLNGQVIVREEGVGLLRLEEGGFRPLPGGAYFATRRTRAVLPWRNADFLVATHEEGLFLVEGGQVRPFRTEVDEALRRDLLFRVRPIPDGGLLLGTLRGGMLRIDAGGRLLQRIGKEEGLASNTIREMGLDADGGLWLALEHGLSRVELDSPLSRFDERRGLTGTVLVVARHQSTLLAGTDSGLLRLDPASRTFVPIPGFSGSVISMLDWDQRLLAGTYAGVVEVRGDRIDWIWKSPNAVFSLHRSRKEPSVLWVGTQGGLRRLREGGSRWKDEGAVPGLVGAVRTQYEAPDGTLWLGTSAQGVFSVTPGSDGSVQVQRYGTAEGLPSLAHTYVHGIRGEMLVSSHQGIYRRVGDRFEPHPAFAGLFQDGPRWVYALREGPGGRIWMHSCQERLGQNETGTVEFEASGAARWNIDATARFSGAWVETILAEENGVVWFGGPEGLVRLEPGQGPPSGHRFQTMLRQVSAGGDRGLNISEKAVLAFRDNRIRFEMGAGSLDLPSATRFQVWLEGLDCGWSPWMSEGHKEYANLSEGAYVFHARSRNLFGEIGEEAVFRFAIRPPFYRTWWAYAAYLVLGLGGLVAYMRLRLASLQRRNVALAGKVAERTQALAARNVELEVMDSTVKAINRETGMVAVLQAILDQSLTHFPKAERGLVLMQDGQGGRFRIPASVGFFPGALEGLEFSPAELEERYVRGAEPLQPGVFQVRKPSAEIGSTHLAGQLVPAAILAMHLELSDGLAGYLLLEHRSDAEAFQGIDLEMLGRFREHALSALAKARLVDSLAHTSERLRESGEQKTRFMGIVAHDLRNPINSIILASQLLEAEEEPAEIVAIARRIGREGSDMNDLIARFLDAAAIEEGRLRPEPEPVDVAAIARNVAERYQARAREKGLGLELDLPGEPLSAQVDPRFLKEILDNLTSNALKFSRQGSEVRLRAFREQGRVNVCIQDQGPGFTHEDRERLFQRYSMLSARPTAGEKSTGLGLSIVKYMVDALGAELELQSEPGCGATFTLRLPVS